MRRWSFVVGRSRVAAYCGVRAALRTPEGQKLAAIPVSQIGVNLAIGDPQGLEPSVYAVCSGPAEGGPFQRTVDEARSTRSQSVEVFVPVVATRVG
jgi:hypothetical protein